MEGNLSTNAVHLAQHKDRRKWWSLTIVLFATFMAILDVFIVNVAIPQMKKGLTATDAQIEWVVAAYTLAYAVLLVTGGRFGDLFGRKKMFIAGVTGFTAASLLCGLADTASWLIAARIFQGVSAAVMVPQVLSTIQASFPNQKERGVALGIYGAVIGIASVAGQIIGGLLIEWNMLDMGWRNVFFINIPFGIAAILGAVFILQETVLEKAKRIDAIGVILITAGLLLFVYPFIGGSDLGWPAWTWVSLAVSILVLSFFLQYENRLKQKNKSPLIDLKLFQNSAFNFGMIVILAYYSGNAGLYYVLTLYLQQGLGLEPYLSGMTFLPLGFGFAVFSMLTPRLVRKFSINIVYAGVIIMFLSYVAIIAIIRLSSGETSVPALAAALFFAGVGQGMIAPLLIQSILAKTAKEDAGTASGVLTTFTQVSQTLGIVAIAAVFYSIRESHHNDSIAFQSAIWILICLCLAITAGLVKLISANKPRAGQ
ncbi:MULTISPECIES: MFS transporter [Paenibacillus]|uniref:MFS transporter n=1 Tax=Paenibacillus albilobatus TaxID=2716884 RepID=A0A919XFP2_9BACL|nr:MULTISPECIES: MFS transporter [Paenibacillus]GIO31306.1 MFS transporter [Paenibacillus albilobatus]